jgi:hypothetical protein
MNQKPPLASADTFDFPKKETSNLSGAFFDFPQTELLSGN